MLALVKKPHIEMSINGDHVDELLVWISKKFEVNVITSDRSDSLPIEETDFWKEMNSNRIGNMLAGARLKAGLTQVQLAEKLKIRQNMISYYEKGKRHLTPDMAKRLAKALKIKVERLT